MMKILCTISIFLVIGNAGANCQDTKIKLDSCILFEIGNGKDLLKDCRGSYFRDKVDSFWIADLKDIKDLQLNLYKISNQLQGSQSYLIQFLGIIWNGEKYIYINAFPKYQLSYILRVHQDLKKSAVIACGGGNLFWRVLFNPKTHEFSNLIINEPM